MKRRSRLGRILGLGLLLGVSLASISVVQILLTPDRPFHQFEHGLWNEDVAFSPDGRYLVTAGQEKKTIGSSPQGPVWKSVASVRLWQSGSWRPVHRLPGALRLCGFTSDGSKLLTSDKDGWARLWDTRSWQNRKIARAFAVGMGDTPCAALSPDGTRIATNAHDIDSPTDLVLWQTAPMKRVKAVDFTGCIAGFSADSRLLAYEYQKPSTAWGFTVMDAGTGKPLRFLEGQPLAFAPDGKTLAHHDGAGNLTLWNTTTWNRLRQFRAPGSPVKILAFSPDTRYLAVGIGKRLSLLDAESGQELMHLSMEGPVISIAFSPDGTVLAAATWNGKIKLWRIPPPSHLRLRARFRHLRP